MTIQRVYSQLKFFIPAVWDDTQVFGPESSKRGWGLGKQNPGVVVGEVLSKQAVLQKLR